MKLLIIEDETAIRDNTATYFRKLHFDCILAADYGEAKQQLLEGQFDCILLDITLPGGSGLDLLHWIRDCRRKEGIIILTARDSLENKIQGLQLGADDYVTKPFHLPEVSARVQSVIRRTQFGATKELVFGDLRINTEDRQCYLGDDPLPLTRKERDLLLLLVANKNRIVTKSAISDHLADEQMGYFITSDVIYSHMKNLKRKLAQVGCGDYIRTIHGLGYKFQFHETVA